MTGAEVARLREEAREVRKLTLQAVYWGKAGHVGGPLSCADIMVALYFKVARIDPSRPDWPDRYRIILSKGHSCLAQYGAMARRGYFPVDEVRTFDQIDSRLQGHPDMCKLPGLDMSSGSLGQGLSAGLGMALGARLKGLDFHTWVVLGDGECQEGQIWEAAGMASRFGVDNLTAIVDGNGLQQFSDWGGLLPRDRWQPLEQASQRWRAFGWEVQEIDGHAPEAIVAACERARGARGRPSVILARTVKGKGVSFMENDASWHARVPTDGELARALKELAE